MPYAPHRLGKMSWLPYAILLICVAGALGAGYWVWQAYEFSRAFRALKAERYEEVLPHTERLIAFGPDKRRAEVIQVRALIELDLEGARAELDNLLADGGVREHPEVGLAYLRLRLESDDLEDIDEYLDEWEASLAAQPEYHLIRAKIRQKQQRWSECYMSLEQLLAVDPSNAEGLLLKSKLLLAQSDPTSAIQAKANLRQAAEEGGPAKLEALHLMAGHPMIPLFENDREWLMHSLRQHRRATSTSRLLADTQEIILKPGKRDAIIADAIVREGMKDPRQLAQWLMAQGAYPQLIKFLQSPAAEGLGEERWAAELSASMLSQDAENLDRLLAEEGKEVNEVSRATLLAHANASATNPTAEPTPQWRQAFAMAQEANASNELTSLAQLALSMRWLEEAELAFEAALNASDNQALKIRIFNLYLMTAIMQGNTEKGLEITRRSLALKPDDDGMLNNRYYLEALLNTQPDADPHRMSDLIERNPGSVFLSTYAFLLWQAGLQEEAREQFAQMERRYWQTPSCRIVGGLIAIDDEQYDLARRFLDGIDSSQLIPEEAALLAQARQQLDKHQPEL